MFHTYDALKCAGPEDQPRWWRGGGLPQYAAYVANHLRPFIDAHYLTIADRAHRVALGSAHGGLAAFWTGVMHGGDIVLRTDFGYQDGRDLWAREDPDGGHNDDAWSRRLPDALRFALGAGYKAEIEDRPLRLHARNRQTHAGTTTVDCSEDRDAGGVVAANNEPDPAEPADQQTWKRKLESAKDDVKAVGGLDVFRSGEWLQNLTRQSLHSFFERVLPAEVPGPG